VLRLLEQRFQQGVEVAGVVRLAGLDQHQNLPPGVERDGLSPADSSSSRSSPRARSKGSTPICSRATRPLPARG
jgi:hypothetical protein